MKRKIGLFFVAAVSVMCIAFGAAACTSDSNDRNDNDDKVINVVPTYQGMTISRDDTGTSKASTMSVAMTKEKPGNSGNGGDNGYNPWEDRPGWNPGDGNPHYDYDNEDKEEPEEDIEDIVDIDVVEDSEVRYYVDPGETFIIEVHLSNPSNYIIQSFTLNGKIYANYMYEDDSTLELLRLEVVAPTIPGYTEYTIDAIKYIDSNDNNTIKDAAFEGDKSVSAGVTYTSEPIATISSLKVGTTTADMIVALEDSQDVLGDAPVNFYLTKDDEVVYTSLLKKGSNSLSFDELLMGQTYQYGVGTYYDLIDGNGVCDHWLNTGSFVTQKSFAITNAAIYKTQVEFTVSKTGDDGEIKAIELIDAADEKVVSTLSDFTKTWFTDLLSNHEYKIKVSFSYESVGQTIEDSTAISFVTGAKTAPALELENVTADKDSISFTSAITDTDGILEIKSANLIKDGKLIQSLEDLTMRKFEGLLSDAEYELVVNYSYDLNDGMGEHSATASTTVKTLAKAVPTVSIEGVTATQTDISFDISTVDTDDTLTIGAIVLSNQRGDIIQIQDVDSLVASGLLSDTEYEIKVNYTYDLNDGNGEHNMAVMAKGKTLAKVAPSVEIENIATTQTGVSFELETVDKDNILAIESVVLSNEEGKVAELESLDELSFSGLLSDNEYTITVNYSYDLNNGKGVQKATAIEIVKTIAKAVPTVNADFSDIQTDSLNGAVSFIDADIVGEVTSVEIYNANELVAAIDDYSQFNVSGLSAYTLYELRVQYSYDLNDGNGIQNDMAVFEVTTLPVFEFTSFKVINTSAVSEGEVIYIQANIYNPNGATFTSATINGKEYAVDPVSTTTYMYVQITNDGQFAGGETAIMVEKIVVTLDEAKYTILPEKDNTGKVFINGNLYADSISIVNNDKEATEYGYAGDKYYIQLNLTNPTGYEVYSVAYDGMYGDQTVTNGIIKGDSADIWYIPVDMYNGTNRITMKSIKYRNDYLDRETNVQLETHFYIAKGSEPVEVKTADDLLNMDEGYVYELKNDINLGGMQWDGGDFNGVFLGNGYAITNMSVVTTIDGTEVYLGLFDHGEGIIENLTIDCATYFVDFVGTGVNVKYGALVAYSSNILALNNCNVENSVASFTGDDTFYVYVGGLVGDSSTVFLNNCFNTSNINVNIQGSDAAIYVAGLVASSGDLRVQDCCNEGNIDVKWFAKDDTSKFIYVGGVVGSAHANILKSHNKGNVSLECSTSGTLWAYTAGLVGYLSLNSDIVMDSYNVGDVTTICPKNYYELRTAGIVGMNGTVINSYNSGSISGVENVGGISGYGGNIEMSYNSGFIHGKNSIGGLVGAGSISIQNSYNLGDVNGVNFVGGLVGNIGGLIASCYNSGNVVAGDYVGGLVGYANIELDIKNSFNQGFVSGNTLIGGIVGYEEAEGGIQNTYNYGKINGTSEYFGISSSQNIVLTTVHQIPEGITAIGQNAFYNVTQLKAVIIPETVVSIEQGAFSNCTATLYVVVNRKLAGWADDWNGGRPVVWGYKGNIVTYKFESNGGTEIGPITTTIAADLPTPEREGYIFLGWYTTPDFSGEAVGSTYYNPEGATFYAKWLDITLQSYGLEIRDGVIVSIGSCTDTELKIALPVGENAFESNENIVSVYFFESCTSIGEYAFNGCTNLKSVTFAENSRLSYLGSYAFSGCDILKEIELPCGLTEIPSYAFQSCDMLNTVILPDGVVRIADYAFANDIALIDIVIPSSIIEIGGSAFYYCNNLVSVQFMKGSMLERISWDAFSTTGISHFVIPEGVVYIGGNAFGNCSYLEYIVIPESVSTIDGEIFNGCNELTIYVELESKPSGWNSGWNSGKSVIWNYGKQAAYSFETNGGTSLQNISSDEFITLPIPEKTNNVFAGWYDNSDFLGEKLGKTYYNAQGATLYAKWIDISLQSNGLEITDGVITSIGTCNDTELKIALPVAANAFESNREIVSVYFISTCTSIGDYAFNGCSNLKSVTFAENSKLSYLGSYAFSDCDSLTEINLPYGLSSISMSVFQNCDALMSVMLPESITVIEDSAFESCVNLLEIIIPQTVVEIAYGAFLNCSSLTMVTFKDESQLLKIGAWAFGYDVNLTSIILPEGLTTIEYDAFSYCSNLEVIVIPISVSQIGSGLFGDCNKLTIYAEADSKPAQWTSGWNSGCSVVWGFGKTEVAYNFVSNGGTIYESVISNTLITLPVPERNGFVFGGWYDNAEFDGKVLNGSYYNAVGATLYAKWYDLNGFTQSQGLEIIDGVIVGVGTCADSVLTINMPVADYAFIECQTITKVIIGPCVSSLGYQAFAYCYNLKEVTFISEVPPQISQDVFGTTWDNSDFVVYVPVAALEDYLAVPDSYWQDYLVGQGKVQAM